MGEACGADKCVDFQTLFTQITSTCAVLLPLVALFAVVVLTAMSKEAPLTLITCKVPTWSSSWVSPGECCGKSLSSDDGRHWINRSRPQLSRGDVH
jgi:hypothetical protein